MCQRNTFVLGVAIICWLLFPRSLSARIPIAEGTEDIRDLAESASFVFHARVVSIDLIRGTPDWGEGTANLAVDRWYKGKPRPATVRMKFLYPGIISGHDCIDFRRTSSWLIFANQGADGSFVFSHDCEGGLPMSPILAPPTSGVWLEQLQQDLIAGLRDDDPAERLANIARLAGLKLRSSAGALHEFVEHGSEIESKWAVYAAFRLGDLSVLPEVERMVIAITETPATLRHPLSSERPLDAAPSGHGGRYAYPDIEIALEFRYLRDRHAVPALIRIAQSAKASLVRDCAMAALAEIKDPRSVPVAADHLSDPDSAIRFHALITISYVTNEPACMLPQDWKEQDVPVVIEKCKKWWSDTGSSRPWGASAMSK